MNKTIAKICIFIACGGIGVAHAGVFQVTTIPLNAGDEFKFVLGASGTFTIDCGKDGTLVGDDIDSDGKTIKKGNTDTLLYKCIYSNGGEKIINFDGHATGYNDDGDTIFFAYNPKPIEDEVFDFSCNKIKSIKGSLGSIFPIIDNKLSFGATFHGCYHLEFIPENLFSGVNGATNRMFIGTFYSCENLKEIPKNLFSGISGAADKMFMATFKGCKSLTSIPENLFRGVSGAADNMFMTTFNNCESLTYIPENLFSGVNNTANDMFRSTFSGCTKLTGYIPASTFAGLIANNSPMMENMWANTFTRTNLSMTCPDGTKTVETPYQQAWGGYAVCEQKTEQPIPNPNVSRFDFNSIDKMLNDSFWKSSVWTDADGGFNTARLVYDSVAVVALGTVGGVITSKIIKKNQLKSGLQTLKCTIGGQAVANIGDEFTIEVK